MKWTRTELKNRAKEALKRNYWRIVLVSLIAILIGGAGGGASARPDNVRHNIEEGFDNEFRNGSDGDADLPDFDMRNWGINSAIIAVYAVTVLFVVIIVVAVVVLFDVFLLNPILVGIDRFMLKSVDDKAAISEVGYTFDHNYKNGVKVMFFKDLYIALWSLLLVIPGIYKAYQYRMVSYIIAEHPDMPYKDALQMSSDMMNGHKWDAFVLDLSFILWHILGGITCGIAEIFYVAPYVNLTNAALYRKLTEDNEIWHTRY